VIQAQPDANGLARVGMDGHRKGLVVQVIIDDLDIEHGDLELKKEE